MTESPDGGTGALAGASPLLSPLVDITCVNAAESIFRAGAGDPTDPWGHDQAIRFTDLYVFSSKPRYPLPVQQEEADKERGVPSLILRLEDLDSKALKVQKCIQDLDERHLDPRDLENAFDAFSNWILRNEGKFRDLIRVHDQPWIREGQREKNLRTGHFYNVDYLVRTEKVIPFADKIRVSPRNLLYAFDVVLRYPLYGEAAGDGNFYLAHPMREEQKLPKMKRDAGPQVTIPFSLGAILGPLLNSFSTEHYANILHESRHLLRERSVINDDDGTFDQERAKDFLSRMELCVQLKKPMKALGVLGGALSMLGSVPQFAGPVAIGGGAITVGSNFWSGRIAKVAARRWLRWAVEWHVKLKKRRYQ